MEESLNLVIGISALLHGLIVFLKQVQCSIFQLS